VKLHDYQEVAVEHISRNPRAALYLDPGLGKTAITLSAIKEDWLPALVIAPMRVARDTWPTEVKKWRPDLSYQAIQKLGGDARSLMMQIGGADITFIGRDVAKLAIRRKGTLAIPKWKTLIYDESSGIKNKSSSRWKVAKHISQRAERTILLSGTPAPNGLTDLWSQMFLLDDGRRLGKTLKEFRHRHYYVTHKNEYGGMEWALHEGMDKKIHEKIADLALGMQAKYRIKLPPLTYNEIGVDLPPKVKAVYNEIRRELAVDLEDIFGGEVHTAANAGVLSSKLSQIAAGGLYPDQDSENVGIAQVLHHLKTDVVADIVEEEQGKPILVFRRFRFEQEDLLKRFPKAMSIDDPRYSQDKWDRGEIPMLVTHPASAAHGLNLQYSCNTMIWTSPTWELEHWEQGIARLHRQGQTQPVIIHTILADGTVDKRVVTRLKTKAEVQDALRDAIESPL
jgi:SNF2 family DNA or RNA helicase